MEASDTLKERALQLAKRPALSFYDLAVALDALHDEDPSLIKGIPEISGMSRRRLYYLIDVGWVIRECHLTKVEAESVGWTKLQLIARHLATGKGGTEYLTSYIDLARGTPARSLARALAGHSVSGSRAVQFNLSLGARAELSAALLEFGAKGNPKRLLNKESALIAIVRAAMAAKGLRY